MFEANQSWDHCRATKPWSPIHQIVSVIFPPKLLLLIFCTVCSIFACSTTEFFFLRVSTEWFIWSIPLKRGFIIKKGEKNQFIFCYGICIHLNILLKQLICEDEPLLISNKDICEYHIGFLVASATLVVTKLQFKKLVTALSSFQFVLFMLHPPCQFNLLCPASSNTSYAQKVVSAIHWGIKSSTSMCPFCFGTASELFVVTDALH